MGVEFEKAATIFCVANDAQHVDVIRVALFDQAAAGVRQHREVGMIHGAQDASGLLRARQMKLAVHRTDHQVEPAQHLVRQVEAAIFQDVHLDSLEQRDAVELQVEAVDLFALPRQLQRIEAMRHGQVARMLGDGEVLQPQRLAASAISRRLSWPSVARVWACRSPRRSANSTRFGKRPPCAASISPRSSRSSGGMKGRPTLGRPRPRPRRRCVRSHGTRRIR